jgi:vacuolar protein sorting-associated protein VTA1
VAYYCRTYAVDKGIKLRIDDPAVNNFLFGVMDNLELAKKSLDENKDSGAITCENYAYNIFSKADEEYRSGNSTKDTARKFYAASSYYDILEQFGPLDDEVLEKRKYAKWKAADILRAIQAGQRPTLPESESVRHIIQLLSDSAKESSIYYID